MKRRCRNSLGQIFKIEVETIIASTNETLEQYIGEKELETKNLKKADRSSNKHSCQREILTSS